jgi:hypothetical protein
LGEIRTIYPQIRACSYSKVAVFNSATENVEQENVVIFSLNKNTLNATEKDKIEAWLKTRIHSEKIQVFYTD